MDIQQNHTKGAFPVADIQGFAIHGQFVDLFRDHDLRFCSIVQHKVQCTRGTNKIKKK